MLQFHKFFSSEVMSTMACIDALPHGGQSEAPILIEVLERPFMLKLPCRLQVHKLLDLDQARITIHAHISALVDNFQL